MHCFISLRIFLLLAVFGLGACKPKGKAEPGMGPGARKPAIFPVAIESVRSEAVPFVIKGVGTVEAFERVQVTARVAGVLERVSFREGDRIRAGQIMATIEPLRYRLAADAARAAVEKSHASKADAQAGLSRRESAVEKNPGLIPGEEVATWRTRLRSTDADVAAAVAALAQSELALRDAYVRAPVAGVIETRSAQTGQYVQPGIVLATLVQRDPLLLRFAIPPSEARHVARGQRVEFAVQESEIPYYAKISHVSAAADAETRMVTITAEVESLPKSRDKAVKDDEGPRPGAFAEVTVPLGESRASPVVPETAIRPGAQGFVAYIVKDGRASMRVLQLGLRTGDGRVEVRAGLSVNDQLVVRGAEALREGVPVVITQAKGDSLSISGTPSAAPAAP
jgi:membrane fusion protein, multidrug efflux system